MSCNLAGSIWTSSVRIFSKIKVSTGPTKKENQWHKTKPLLRVSSLGKSPSSVICLSLRKNLQRRGNKLTDLICAICEYQKWTTKENKKDMYDKKGDTNGWLHQFRPSNNPEKRTSAIILWETPVFKSNHSKDSQLPASSYASQPNCLNSSGLSMANCFDAMTPDDCDNVCILLITWVIQTHQNSPPATAVHLSSTSE